MGYVPRISESREVPLEPVCMRLVLFQGLARVGKEGSWAIGGLTPGIPFRVSSGDSADFCLSTQVLFLEMVSVSSLPHTDNYPPHSLLENISDVC